MNIKKILLILFLCLFPNYSHAYVDPGIFALVWQSIIAFLFASLAYFRFFYIKTTNILNNNALTAKTNSLWSKCKIIPSPLVTNNDVARIHNEKYLLHLTNQCKHAIDKVFFPLYNPSETCPSIDDDDINEDIYYSAGTERAVKRAAGGAVQSVRELFVIDAKTGRAINRSSTSSSFAIVRPPGHHCCNGASGFCYLNNVAIAAKHAQEVLGLKKVAIIDWDYHHGDGTQEIFYKDPTVLTISIHVSLSFVRVDDEEEEEGEADETPSLPHKSSHTNNIYIYNYITIKIRDVLSQRLIR